MNEITEEIINYTKAKHTYKKWYIGLTDNTKEIRKYFQNKTKIVCAYFQAWPCKNKIEARKILKEFENLDFIICKKTPNPIIFIFLPIFPMLSP